jgi:hypothetical protein
MQRDARKSRERRLSTTCDLARHAYGQLQDFAQRMQIIRARRGQAHLPEIRRKCGNTDVGDGVSRDVGSLCQADPERGVLAGDLVEHDHQVSGNIMVAATAFSFRDVSGASGSMQTM